MVAIATLDDRIRELYAAGLSDPQIAAAAGVCRDTVCSRRAAMGLASRHNTSNGYRHGHEEETDYDAIERTALAYRLAVCGRDLDFIATACGVTADEAKAIVGRMPKWWRRECGVRDERAARGVKLYPGARRGGERKFKARA